MSWCSFQLVMGDQNVLFIDKHPAFLGGFHPVASPLRRYGGKKEVNQGAIILGNLIALTACSHVVARIFAGVDQVPVARRADNLAVGLHYQTVVATVNIHSLEHFAAGLEGPSG